MIMAIFLDPIITCTYTLNSLYVLNIRQAVNCCKRSTYTCEKTTEFRNGVSVCVREREGP